MSDCIDAWPDDLPLIFLGGKGRWSILGMSFDEVAFDELDQIDLVGGCSGGYSSSNLPFHLGVVGIIGYDGVDSTNPLSRIVRLYSALVFDHETQQLWMTGSSNQNAQWSMADADGWLNNLCLKPLGYRMGSNTSGLLLQPHETDASYIAKVEQAQEDIRDGRFYQINLLRYFDAEFPVPLEERQGWLRHRLLSCGGAYSCWFRFEDLEVVSFSPERFVSWFPENDNISVETYPIKGTAPRFYDPVMDLEAQRNLSSSEKDLAELHMIVDLMRNDLNRISLPGSVKVLEGSRVKTLSYVHHLEAKIESKMRPQLRFSEIWKSIAPAGSITGAPKKEVMEAIFSSEKRSRKWFMGNCFYWDTGTGQFDSSVMIRTLVREHQSWEYAAGSGIVLASNSMAEQQEINHKCRVVSKDMVPESNQLLTFN